MSILAETSATVIPPGTWTIDPSWSSLEFEVRKLGLVTIKGRVPGFSGTIAGGESADGRGRRRRRDHHDVRRRPRRAPAVPRVLRHARATPSCASLRRRSSRTATSWSSPATSRSRTSRGRSSSAGTLTRPGERPVGQRPHRPRARATVDRTAFGLEWNAPLPGGGFLLPNDVVLKANFAATRTA